MALCNAKPAKTQGGVAKRCGGLFCKKTLKGTLHTPKQKARRISQAFVLFCVGFIAKRKMRVVGDASFELATPAV